MQESEKQYTISVLTENRSGLLNHLTIILNRRKINIDSLNASATEVKGISRFTIVITTSKSNVENCVKQFRKLIEVLGAFVYEEDEIYYQEIALYKVPTSIFLNGNKIETLLRNNGARILVIEEEHIVIEKTGHPADIHNLYMKLKPLGLLEFTRSGRVILSKSKRKAETYIKKLESTKSNQLNITDY